MKGAFVLVCVLGLFLTSQACVQQGGHCSPSHLAEDAYTCCTTASNPAQANDLHCVCADTDPTHDLCLDYRCTHEIPVGK